MEAHNDKAAGASRLALQDTQSLHLKATVEQAWGA